MTALTLQEVRTKRAQIEHQIAVCQQVIDEFCQWRDTVDKEFTSRVTVAFSAMQQQQALLHQIETESLWYGDYQSAADYFDQTGFSRQRYHQIKLEVIWCKLVGNYNDALPRPSGRNARDMGTLPPEKALPAYAKAIEEGNGHASDSSVHTWMQAVREGVEVTDSDAVTRWRDRQHLNEIATHFKQLQTEEARREAGQICQPD